MAKRKSRKKKTKSKSRKKTQKKQRSKLDLLKEKQSILYARVEENAQAIIKQTGIEREEYDNAVSKYGFESLSSIEGFDIIGPIWDQMVELHEVYTELSKYVERLKVLESKKLIYDTKKQVEELEIEMQEIEKEDSYYTEKPDKEGIVKMKDKYHTEKEFWNNRKNKFEKYLKEDHDDLTEQDRAKMQIELDEAKKELGILAKKRRWAIQKNIQPNITKWTQKISKGIATVQDSIGEVTKPFAEAGKASGGNAKTPNFENMFSSGGEDANIGKKYEKMFSGGNDANIGKKYEDMFTDKPRETKETKKKKKSDEEEPKEKSNDYSWENYF